MSPLRCPIQRAKPLHARFCDNALQKPPKVSLKALLAAAPLDGINLDRGHDVGRDVDL